MRGFDVAVCGGGAVGAAFACALATARSAAALRIAVIEPAGGGSAPAADSPPDLRTLAVSPASRDLLERTGVWDAVAATGRLGRYRGMQVWDAGAPGHLRFGAPGDIVENALVQAKLWERLEGLDNVTLITGARVARVSHPERGVRTLALDKDTEAVAARLVVGADGGGSPVRSMVGLPVVSCDYERRAVVATVKLDEPTDTAWQRFLPLGPVAVLPLWDRYASIVWSTGVDHAHELCALDPEAFRERLQAALAVQPEGSEQGGILANLVAVAAGEPTRAPPAIEWTGPRRASFPLTLRHASRYVKERVALIGDAAHTVHPMAGQGANLGFSDAAELAKVLGAAFENGEDPGAVTTLERYARARQTTNKAMLAGIDLIGRVFGIEGQAAAAVRGAGMSLLTRAGPLRAGLERIASGKPL